MDIDLTAMDVEELNTLRSKIDAILDGPASGLTTLDDVVATLKVAKERAAGVGKAAIANLVKVFFAAHPEVESLRWKQYTPYFDDGDACEFRVHTPYVKLVGSPDDGGDHDDGFEDSWGLEYNAEQSKQPKPEALIKALKSIKPTLEDSADILKATFGDHVQITIGQSLEAEIEEYEHD